MSDWYRYAWQLQGENAQFLVDLSYAEAFDALGDFTTLLHVSCFSMAEDAQTFTKRELRQLDRILARCRETLGDKAVYVGSIDVHAQRRYYFYTADARLIVPLMAACSGFLAIRIECGKSAEPNRQTYYRLLLPDAEKRQSADNARYIQTLVGRGDDSAAVRRVNLHLYLPTALSRERFVRDAKSLGFAIGNGDYVPERELPYYIVIHAVAPLTVEAVTELTTKAIRAAQPYGGVLEHFDSAFVPRRSWL